MVELKSAKLFTQQKVVTASRSIGTVFKNTTGKPMFCTVTIRTGPGGDVVFLSDLANPPTTTVVRVSNNQGAVSAGNVLIDFDPAFIVLPNHFYEVSIASGTATLQIWTEWT